VKTKLTKTALAVLIGSAVFFSWFHFYTQDKERKEIANLLGQLHLSIVDEPPLDYEQKIYRLRHPDSKTLQLLMDEIKDIGAVEKVDYSNAAGRIIRIRKAFEIVGTNAAPLIPDLRKEFLSGNNVGDSAWALVYIGGNAWPTLFEGLTNSNEGIRNSSVFAMSYTSGTNAVLALPYLESFLTNRSDVTRSVAADSLGNLPVDASMKLPALIQCAERDANITVRVSAVKAIQHIGLNSPTVSDALKRISESDENEFVKRFAAKSLEEIQSSKIK
jgi:hypothetical protein